MRNSGLESKVYTYACLLAVVHLEVVTDLSTETFLQALQYSLKEDEDGFASKET